MTTYKQASKAFTALGNERGLLLVMKRGRLISFSSPEKKLVDVFATSATVAGPHPARHDLTITRID